MCARSSTAELSSYTRPVLGSNPSARTEGAHSLVVKRYFDIVKTEGSIPSAPTTEHNYE